MITPKQLLILITLATQVAGAVPELSPFCKDLGEQALNASQAIERTQWARKCLPSSASEMPGNSAIVAKDPNTQREYVTYPIFGSLMTGGQAAHWFAPVDARQDCSNLNADQIIGYCVADEAKFRAEEQAARDQAAREQAAAAERARAEAEANRQKEEELRQLRARIRAERWDRVCRNICY